MHNDAPVYLCELVCPYQPTRTLRSANNNVLKVKRTRTKAGDCSFTIAAASRKTLYTRLIKRGQSGAISVKGKNKSMF